MKPAFPASTSPAWERYSRQILFPGVGADGQRRLLASHAAIVGVGATGAAMAGLLARAGVGKITLIDRDVVEASNLQRQALYTEADARDGLPKADAARQHLLEQNSEIDVTAYVADLTPANAAELLGDAGLLLDGTDNYETRFLLNDLAVSSGRPWIYTAALGSYAATMNILPRGVAGAAPDAVTPAAVAPTACLACIFGAPPQGEVETCDTGGILGPAVQLAASVAACEALKFLSGHADLMRRTLLGWDLWTGEYTRVDAGSPDPECAVCARRDFRFLHGARRAHITLCGRNSVQIHEHGRTLDLAALAERLRPLGTVRANSGMLRFALPEYTLTVFPDGRALIQGTTDIAAARSLYARFVGA